MNPRQKAAGYLLLERLALQMMTAAGRIAARAGRIADWARRRADKLRGLVAMLLVFIAAGYLSAEAAMIFAAVVTSPVAVPVAVMMALR